MTRWSDFDCSMQEKVQEITAAETHYGRYQEAMWNLDTALQAVADREASPPEVMAFRGGAPYRSQVTRPYRKKFCVRAGRQQGGGGAPATHVVAEGVA